MSLIDIIFTLAILFVLVATIVLALIYLVIEIKCSRYVIQYRFLGGSCWGMKECGKDNCRLRHFCYIYKNAISPEVVADLEHMLEERRRELEEDL